MYNYIIVYVYIYIYIYVHTRMSTCLKKRRMHHIPQHTARSERHTAHRIGHTSSISISMIMFIMIIIISISSISRA